LHIAEAFGLKMAGQGKRLFFVAVHDKNSLQLLAAAFGELDQFFAICMGGKGVDHFDSGVEFPLDAENAHPPPLLHQTTPQGVLRLIANDEDGVVGILDVVS
jgi:hypothetical protein